MINILAILQVRSLVPYIDALVYQTGSDNLRVDLKDWRTGDKVEDKNLEYFAISKAIATPEEHWDYKILQN